MSSRAWSRTLIAVLVVVAFGAGYLARGSSSGYQFLTGDSYTGMNVASCTVGNTTYGVSNVVAWTDAHNVIRGGLSDAAEWPTCLPSVTEVKGSPLRRGMAPNR